MSKPLRPGPGRVRPYRSADRTACLGLFDSNVPDFFAARERDDFLGFVDDLHGPYFVIDDEAGKPVACGGYDVDDKDGSVAILCWGMVRRDRHKAGLGRRLLVERLERIAADPAFASVAIETTPFSRGFFEHFGFVAGRIEPDGFAPGFDRVEMTLDLSGYRRR